MIRALVALASTITIAACANVVESSPSYLGMTTGSLPSDTQASAEVPGAVRHMNSNKVLGALAFQKVTGARVDPAALTGSRP